MCSFYCYHALPLEEEDTCICGVLLENNKFFHNFSTLKGNIQFQLKAIAKATADKCKQNTEYQEKGGDGR